jgi:adenylate cyclase
MATAMGNWRLLRTAWWRRQLAGGRLIGLAVMVIMLTVRGADPILLDILRARTFDLYQTLKPRPSPAERPVVVVDLDEASLAEIGQWPWPRTIVAQMVDNLTVAGAAVIGFDIVFAEPDRLSPAMMAESLPDLDEVTRRRLAAAKSNDQVLAEAMRRSSVVVGQAGADQPVRRADRLPVVPSIVRVGGDPRPQLERYRSILRNVPEIDLAAAGWGVFSVSAEADGVVRRVPAVLTDGEQIYPALSLEMLRLATANENLGVKSGPDGVIGVIVRPNLVATDARGRIWLYAARHDPGKFLSAKTVVANHFDAERVAGRLVLIGTSAIGLQDIRATAVERVIPGVELHAQIIETILSGTQLSNPPDAAGVEMVAAMVGALLMIVLVPIIGARWTLLLFLLTAVSLTAASWYRFAEQRLLYDPVFPVATTLLTFMLVTYASYAREEARKRQVRNAFSRYMSPALVERLAADPSLLKLGGDMRDMTLLFCDVRGFTTISEQFDAQGLTQLINRFLTTMTDAILARRGTIDKYMGDCIMAFWNAPLDDDDHAANACRAALAMQDRLGPLNESLAAEAAAENRSHMPILVGIGLNSGPVVVGNMGSHQRFDYSVLGDTVNLASRLEGQSKFYGVTIVIGENTRRRAPGFACLELDWIRVKGKAEAAQIHALLGDESLAASEAFQTFAARHTAMLDAYRAQDWPGAREALAASRQSNPGLPLEKLYGLYEDRLDNYESAPPGADWDGVFVATTK